MVSNSTNPILKGLSSVMKKEGFIKRSNNWYFHNDETILVVNIQTDYNKRYINFGIWIKKLADKEYVDWFKQYNTALNQEFPRHYQCHIYFRPIHFPKSINKVAEAVFNLENMSVSNDEREKYIIEWLNKYELPILKQCSTVEGIIKALNESELRSAFIGIEVKKFIIPCLIIVLKNLITKKLAQPEITFKNEHNTLVVDDHKDVVNTKTTDVIVEPSNMVTALMLASNDGNLKIVNKLLMQGADPNKKDINGWTALMIAAQKCYVNVVNTLLAHGAQPNISTSDSGTTALTAASDKGYVEVVDKLLASGAEVDFATDSGWTALMFAAQNGHVLVVKKLLANGADLNKKGDGGWTALMLASQGGHTQVVEDLLFDKKVKINEANNYGMTPLMLAIERKYVDIGVKLLERGADSNISVVGEENEGWTALMFASSEGFVEIVNMLLDTGANPNKKNKKGADAIDIAEYFGHKECVAILRKYLN